MNFVVKMMENQGKCKQPMLNHQGKSLRVTMAWWVSWYEIKYIMQKKTKIRLQNKKLSHTESLQPAGFLLCHPKQTFSSSQYTSLQCFAKLLHHNPTSILYKAHKGHKYKYKNTLYKYKYPPLFPLHLTTMLCKAITPQSY